MTDVSAPLQEAPLLQMHVIVALFPGVRALDGVDPDVHRGRRPRLHRHRALVLTDRSRNRWVLRPGTRRQPATSST